MHDQSQRIQNEFVITDSTRPPFEPFMLYFRGMEKIGMDSKGGKNGAISWQFDMSRLSEGVKCATQGCKYYLNFLTSKLPREFGDFSKKKLLFIIFNRFHKKLLQYLFTACLHRTESLFGGQNLSTSMSHLM